MSELKDTVEHIFTKARNKAKRMTKGLTRIHGKAIVFYIRDTNEIFATKSTSNGPILTNDPDKIPDDAAVVNLTEKAAKNLVRGAITPHEARVKFFAEDGKNLLYLTDINFNEDCEGLSAPKQIVWMYAIEFFEELQKEVKEMFVSTWRKNV